MEREAQEIIRNAKQKATQEMEGLVEPLEAEFVANMKEHSTNTKLGYQKAAAAYLAGELAGDEEDTMLSNDGRFVSGYYAYDHNCSPRNV